ncbi:MAG: MMPL family transporter [Shewanella sp.]|nr:MMPL family transporter [Shewanella sp.]MCF1431819.1 MMPL family transporter [Shewanella sp.]MCF1458611.1 MMPL family transporter [Shewanella sp.]
MYGYLIKLWRHPLAIILFWLVLAAGVTPLVWQLNINTRYDAYFAPDDLRYQLSQELADTFNRPDTLWLIIKGPEGWQWQHQQSKLEQIEYLVRSQAKVRHIGGYSVLVGNAEHTNGLLSYKAHPRESLVLSNNGQTLMLELEFEQSALSPVLFGSLIEQLQRQLTAIADNQQLDLFFYGPLALNWQYAEVFSSDLAWFMPSVLLLTAILLGWFVRSWPWLVGIGSSALLSLWFTLAIAGWLALPLTAISGVIPVILVVLSLASGIHLFTGWRRLSNLGLDCIQARRRSIEEHLPPLFWGALTTCCGFLLLTFSPSPPIKAFGILVAFAVAINLLLHLSWLMVIVGLGRGKVSKTTGPRRLECSSRLAILVLRRPALGLSLALLATLMGAYGVTQLKFKDDPLGYFPADNPLRLGAEITAEEFYAANYQTFLYTHSKGALDPQAVRFINRLSRFLKQQPEVVRVDTLVDWFKASGLGPSALEQLFVSNPPSGLGLGKEVTDDLCRQLVQVYLRPTDTASMLALELRIKTWLSQQEYPGELSPALGPQSLYAHLSEDNAINMLLSFLVALVMLSLLLYHLRGSIRLALLGLTANLLPLIWVFGYWGMTGGGLSLGSTMVIGMILGIIVDDTLHLLLRLDAKGSEHPFVLRRQLIRITPAISLTSLVLVAGFMLGMLSDFGPILELSLLSALIISSAWFFDLLVLPSLWRHCFPKQNASQ